MSLELFKGRIQEFNKTTRRTSDARRLQFVFGGNKMQTPFYIFLTMVGTCMLAVAVYIAILTIFQEMQNIDIFEKLKEFNRTDNPNLVNWRVEVNLKMPVFWNILNIHEKILILEMLSSESTITLVMDSPEMVNV
ncbi:4761_t:CDS:2 [Ambispora gerdemannii]|uniref:4761_t:CDS:1 n=1 Tax=Ambispora gerdemannii TaxID=144530 RepID=A0A9N8ZYK3_9GLOM|nr:4761_t:CDS:2 [Ambispora gerdemannii]